MPVLKNPKHERFAQLVSNGESYKKSAQLVGYTERSSESQGSKLASNPKIRERISELGERIVDQAASSVAISKAWVLETLVANVRRAMQEEPVRDHKGVPTGEYIYQGNVANKALELIGKEFGMFVDRKDIKLSKPIHEMTEDELIAIIAEDRTASATRTAESIN